ncbi:MAG: TIGR03790 family protein [Pirellulaceae bacterium]|nr:TIGR03790 family protein [Pirellulaceae bacterium]
MNSTIYRTSVATLIAAVIFANGCAGPSAKSDGLVDRVLVIENLDSPASTQIVKHYMAKRGVKKVLQVHCPDSAVSAANETLPFAAFQEAIEKPLKAFLASDPKIDFIVLTKGVPIRLTGAPVGLNNTQPSLDSYIAGLDYFDRPSSLKVVIDEGGWKGNCFVNNYFDSKERFSHATHGGYLVTRLDGYTVEAAMALVDSSIASDGKKPAGMIFLDASVGAEASDVAKVPQSPVKDGKTNMEMISGLGVKDWNADLLAAGAKLQSGGQPVELEQTAEFVGNKQGLMGYASWGSNDGKFSAESYKSIKFAPGGIAETAVSTSGRTFLPTSGGQSLVADLIDSKVTGVKGYCDEPFLPAIASPTILFDRYTQGWTLAESFYAASRFVAWEDIVIGDPLASPYAK